MNNMIAGAEELWLHLRALRRYAAVMERYRMRIFYSGRVQGVGFRYNTKMVARGYDVMGTVRNLPDGRVEMIAEGTREELEAFLAGIRDSGVGGLIHKEDVSWEPATGGLRGFEIIG